MLSVLLCICDICMCHLPVCAWVCLSLCGGHTLCWRSITFYPFYFFLKEHLSLNQELANWLDWSTSKSLGYTCPSQWWAQHAWYFTWVMRLCTWTTLVKQALYSRDISVAWVCCSRVPLFILPLRLTPLWFDCCCGCWRSVLWFLTFYLLFGLWAFLCSYHLRLTENIRYY